MMDALMIMWNIWNNRNSIVWRTFEQIPSQVVGGARSALGTWKNARLIVGGVVDKGRKTKEEKLRLPSAREFTYNVDAIVFCERRIVMANHPSTSDGGSGDVQGRLGEMS
ncbi:hypothetical protein Sjap_002778 [Stephania japonica]|uniref:Uncharacterized protein n=1 Tax=Stephania japonica TaxID=461633 RepID=A0AAP0KP15_9MAGN